MSPLSPFLAENAKRLFTKLYFPLVIFVAKILAMKKIGRIFKRTTLLMLPLLLAIGAGWLLRTESEFFIIKDLQVDLEYQENQEALLVALKPDVEKSLLDLQGKNIWTVSLRGLQEKVIQHPWVREVELARHFPNRIFALVRLQPVAFLFVDKKNRFIQFWKTEKSCQK